MTDERKWTLQEARAELAKIDAFANADSTTPVCRLAPEAFTHPIGSLLVGSDDPCAITHPGSRKGITNADALQVLCFHHHSKRVQYEIRAKHSHHACNERTGTEL